MTLVCKNANWKIVDVTTVVNVATDKECFNDSLVEKLVRISRLNFLSLFLAEVWFRHRAQGLIKILKLKFGQYFEADMLTWDLTIFGNTMGNKDRGEIIPHTWFHSFLSRKKREIRIAFTFFEKWKIKSFHSFLRSESEIETTRDREREVKIKKILEKQESRWSLQNVYAE